MEAGKMTFVNMLITSFERDGKACCYFGAYRNAFAQDPFVAFVAEITELAKYLPEPDDSALKSAVSGFLRAAERVIPKVLNVGMLTATKAATLSVIGSNEIDEVFNDVADGAGEVTGDALLTLLTILDAIGVGPTTLCFCLRYQNTTSE